MKHIKQTIIALLTAFLIIFSASCKKYKQTDKPLYDVLISHTWQPEGDYIYYRFSPDSSFCIIDDIENNDSCCIYRSNNSTDIFTIMETKWWIEYKNETPFLYIRRIKAYNYQDGEITDSVDFTDEIYELYKVDKYNDYRIVTRYLLAYPESYDPQLIPDEQDSSKKVIFNAAN